MTVDVSGKLIEDTEAELRMHMAANKSQPSRPARNCVKRFRGNALPDFVLWLSFPHARVLHH